MSPSNGLIGVTAQGEGLSRRHFLKSTVGLAGILLVACAPAQPAPSQPTPAAAPPKAPPAAGPVSLSIHVPVNAFAGALNKPLEDVIAEYKKTHPNVDIKYTATAVAQHRDKMATQALAGQLEDVVYTVVQWTTEFAANGWIADLTPRLGELDRADWPESSWIASSYKGKIYGVPHRRDNFAIFYNKDQFQAAGVTKFPDTIEEFIEVGKKLTKADVYGIALVGADHPQTTTQFLSFMLMFGNTMFSKDFTKSVMNEPSAVEATKFYADMVNAHKMAQPTAATDNRGEAEKLWMAGKAAMQLNGPWMLPTIKTQAPNLKYGVGIVPAKKGLPKLSLISGWDWAISSKTKSADAAWDLIKFFNEPKNQASMTNTFPARLSAFKDPRFADPELQPWLESAKISYPNPATPAFPKTGLVIQRIVPAVISGKMTPEAAMAEAHAEAEKVLKEYA